MLCKPPRSFACVLMHVAALLATSANAAQGLDEGGLCAVDPVALVQTEVAVFHGSKPSPRQSLLAEDEAQTTKAESRSEQHIAAPPARVTSSASVDEADGSATRLRLVLVILLSVGLMVISYTWAWTWTASSAARKQRQLQVWGYIDFVICGVLTTSLAPLALSLSLEAGHGAQFSGLILAAVYMASGPGAIVGRLLVTRLSQPAKRYVSVILLGLVSACFFINAMLVHDVPLFWSMRHKDAVFIAMRVAAGFACWAYVSIMLPMVTEVTPITERVKQQLRQNQALMAGCGLGPLLVAVFAAGPLESAQTPPFVLAAPLYVTAALLGAHAVAAWVITPCDAEMMTEAAAVAADSCLIEEAVAHNAVTGTLALPAELPKDERSLWLRKLMFCFGALYGVERAVVTVALESATSYVLETHFHWSLSKIGLSVGIVYLLGFAATFPLSVLKDRMGELFLMRSLSYLALAASVLLVTFIYQSEFVVLFADFVLFTACFLASGVAEGMNLAAAIPGDPWFNQENAWCFRSIVKQNIGRFCGPLVVRSTIWHSATLYGVVQVSMTFGGCILCYGLYQSVRELTYRSKSEAEGLPELRVHEDTPREW
eukprot:CAMPEP_0178385378 /NCGR_PEP_ID=MMETSP0689_2-20121128/8002_1 /TAXON_ID=160604 /ORGANISM="Amphidinium massartii, Strain CS-259" /LENGTH=599 /DNA_ID=CAMNT_0020005659 /DNA_START=39 /DNA_END=1835 /DNA_ORIENTATION=-